MLLIIYGMNIQDLNLNHLNICITQKEELFENADLRKQDNSFCYFKKSIDLEITGAGVLQLLQDGFGFLRAMESY